MRRPYGNIRPGLTLIELLVSLAITALVAAATAAMLAAVTTGISTRRDNRTVMVRASAAQSRLASYIAPSRSILSSNGTDLVLWLDDTRHSGTVHASEIRWPIFNGTAIDAFYVLFPPGWSAVAQNLDDLEYSSGSDWEAVRQYYQAREWLLSIRLVDGLQSVAITTDNADPTLSQQVSYTLGFATETATATVRVSALIQMPQPPLP